MKPDPCIVPSQHRNNVLSFFLLPFFLFLSTSLALAANKKQTTDVWVNRPIQITSRTDAVLDMAVSADGQTIVYISGEEKPTTLWLASADPNIVRYPQKLIGGPSVKSSPAISKNGRFVAYVDTDVDVKGDIYILDRQGNDAKPVRLTGRETEDGGPCFSADSRFLYFHKAVGNGPRRIVSLNLKEGGSQPIDIETAGDAMFCDLSPDNNKLVFVSNRKDSSGDLFILDRDAGSVHQITDGPAIDMFPRWHADNQTIYFSRIGTDTNHDNHLNTSDRSVISRIRVDTPKPISFPVTPLNQISFKPYTGSKRLYFLSSKGGVSNCWALPEEGSIRDAETSGEQLRIAETIAGRIPFDPYQTILAFTRVVERFPDDSTTGAKAGYRVAGILQELSLPRSAIGTYQHLQHTYSNVLPESILSEIRQIGIQFQLSLETAIGFSEKRNLLSKNLTRLYQIAKNNNGVIPAEALIESAAMISKADPGPAGVHDAISKLEAVQSDPLADNSQKARALFLLSKIFEQSAAGSQTIETLRRIVISYPQEHLWVDRAVEGIIDHILTHFTFANRDEKIRKLNLLAIENRNTAPPLAMGALNRIGDLYYKNGEWDQAKSVYENVLETYPVLTTQTAAARLSLAEIFFREEEFRKAIDLYEHEIGIRDATDRIYQLAREGYIRKKISAAEFLFRLGEIPSARSLFKELMDYDDRIVEAHRGYIKCAAVTGDIEAILVKYEENLMADETNPVWLYCTGLCLTYRTDISSIKKAKKRIEKAARLNGSIEYFHQTLGYVYEVLETVYGESGQLEGALLSYQKAYFLNDPEKNPDNAANLELNLGNIYYLMGQYGKAFEFYSDRNQSELAFADPNTEIVFYKRLGESAFQNNDINGAIVAFQKTIERVDALIDPLASSKSFDRLNRYLKDRILDPAIRLENIQKSAEKTAERQSGQNLKAAELVAQASPPPSAQWLTYKQNMLQLVDDQQSINKQAVKLAVAYNEAVAGVPGRLPVENAEQDLSNLTRQVRKALYFPERLIEIKAESLDRLALSYQEKEDWKEAAETFERVFSINEKNENVKNLARNRRSVGYATYRLANSVTGDRRIRLLQKALDDFNQVLPLLDRYGVPEQSKKEQSGLIGISISTSLDAASTTRAARGFSIDQEKRLSETFISRIQLELGNLTLSKIELDKQIQVYSSPDAVKEEDLYGVSLLFHRAGLLENGIGNMEKAFDYFAFSTQLCLKLENPVSAAMNLTNMASTGQKMVSRSAGTGWTTARLETLLSLDKQTTALLSKKTDMTGIHLPMQVHNRLGVFYFHAGDQIDGPAVSVEGTLQKLHLQQKAIGHFTRGISLFESNADNQQREELETAARLYLNLAEAGSVLGDDVSAQLNNEKALKNAETGVFPDLQWRALIGLKRFTPALDVLASVPLSRAGCAPMEILERFGSLVYARLENKDIESALNLAEKLSELERFNRTALFARPQNNQQKAFFSKLYPRLEKIEALEKELAAANPDRRPFVEKRLESEKTLLVRQMGPDNESLPVPYRSIDNPRTKDFAILLASLSQKIEEAAEELASIRITLTDEANNNEKNRTLATQRHQTYMTFVGRYRRLAEKTISARPISSPPDFITMMAAESFDVMDLSEVLTDDDAVARIFRFGHRTTPYAAFLITKEKTTAIAAGNLFELKKRIDETVDWTTPYIAYEDPQSLDFGPAYPYALSASHLKRCINNRKPFKRKLGVLPEILFPEPVTDNYDLQFNGPDEKMLSNQRSPLFSDINTLLIANGPVVAASVPTNPEIPSRETLAVFLDTGTMIRLETLLPEIPNLSLSIVKKGPSNQLYLTGHLFSIYGCPATIFLDNAAERVPLLSEILASYSQLSGIEALVSSITSVSSVVEKIEQPVIEASNRGANSSLYLGHRGMSKREAGNYAQKNFVRYVKAGRSDFDRKKYNSAMIFFENAIAVTYEVPKGNRYLPDLLNYARESAYRAGNMEAALSFATTLVDLLASTKPGSREEATALLRLGLLYSKEEQYERAIALIERAVSIISLKEPDENTVRAFMDLGIVLENATHHETALNRFETAAKISQNLNLHALLAEQYLHIGRVYDLRLNQYASAIASYEKGLAIYAEMDDTEKIAASKLNIGRCYRLLGDFVKADAFFEQSTKMLEEHSSQKQLIKAQLALEQANNAWFQGRYGEAFTFQRQSYRISVQYGFSFLQVMSLNTEGLIWWSLGDYEKAITVLDNALSQAKALAIRPDEIASTLNNLGLVYRDKGELLKALEIFEQAIEIDTSIDSKWGLAYDFRNKGLTLLKLHQFEESSNLFDRAYEISTAIGNRINAAKAVLGKGDALFAAKDFQQAEIAYQTALDLSVSMVIRETQWRALFGLAKVQLSLYDDFDAAEKSLRQSIQVIEQLRSTIKVKQLKENFITDKLDVYETLVALLADNNQPEQAFEIAERSRARNFIDLLGSGQIAFAEGKDQSLYQRQQILQSEIETLEQLVATSNESERLEYEASLGNLRHDLENTVIDMQLQNPQLASMVSVPPVDTHQLIGLMEPETALLSYYLLDKELLCWILKGDWEKAENRIHLQRIPINRNVLEKQILEYRRIIQNIEPYEKHATELYKTIFKPVEKYLDGVQTIGISPHGSLHYLSFSTLYDGSSFLIEQFAFFYVPSAAVLEYTLARRMERPYRSPRVLAVGNPDLGDPVLDLPFAEQEVGSLKWNFPEITILTRENATEKWVVDNISDFDIIHIASHGEFDPVNPLLSAIKLALPNDQTLTKNDFDGNLEAGEIFGLQMNADMVFLSACQTGLGKINAGDDVVGLNRSFFFAGTHTVISSLWRVSDVSTAVLIKAFYRSYMNQNKADCLKKAAMHVKKRYSHPGYWGAFTLVGDYY